MREVEAPATNRDHADIDAGRCHAGEQCLGEPAGVGAVAGRVPIWPLRTAGSEVVER